LTPKNEPRRKSASGPVFGTLHQRGQPLRFRGLCLEGTTSGTRNGLGFQRRTALKVPISYKVAKVAIDSPNSMHTVQRAECQQFSRRKATVFGKSEELSRLSDSDVLTIVQKRKTKQIYIYSSTDVDSLIRELVSRFAGKWKATDVL
jgi:hypothetical protein